MDTDPTRHLPLHPLAFSILLVLLEGAAHGYEVVQKVEAREGGGRTIYASNLYRRIRRLVSDGLLAETPGPEKEDSSLRRYLRVTPLGRAVVQAEAQRLARLVREVATLGLGGTP